MEIMTFLVFFFSLITLAYSKCPSGTSTGLDGSNYCYKFYGASTGFFDAETKCTGINGHLASISSGFLNSFISNFARDTLTSTSTQIWLGGYKPQNSNFSWTDGSPFSYTSWANGQPSSNSQYLALDPSVGLWYASGDAQTTLPFICEVPEISDTCGTPSTCPSNIAQCDSGWTYFNLTSACYKVLHTQAWQGAEGTCQAYGAHLASIHSLAENQFLIDISATGETVTGWSDQVWIGFTDPNGDGNYTWSDGSPVNYTNWGNGAPENPSKYRCALLRADYQTDGTTVRYQHWDDYGCEYQLRAYVCKKTANFV